MDRIYLIRTGRRIAPFLDPVGDMPVGGTTLSAWQRELFARFGLEVVERDADAALDLATPALVTYDDVFFSRRVLKDFLAKWRAAGRPARRLALPRDSAFVRSFSDLSDAPRTDRHALYRLYGLPKGGRLEDAEPLEVIYKDKIIDVRVPHHVTGIERWEHPLTSSVCVEIRHWLHVLFANLLAIQIRWVDEVVRHPLWALSVVARSVVPGRGRLPWRIAGRLNRFGRGVDVHPTARVEASFLGDGVRVGPGALVRASIVGAGATIEQNVDLFASAIGERSFVAKHTVIYGVTSFPDADVCMKGMQMCLVGRRAALTTRATPIDVSPGRKIRVRDGGEVKEIDWPLLGSCFGHDTFIGADVFIAPGREIPNGLRIVPSPERILGKLPSDATPGVPYVVEGGTLKPLP